MRRLLSIALLLSFTTSLSFAASTASFLKLGVGARAEAMGSAYTAVANDVTALYWNPGGLVQLKKKEVGAMHAELFADTRYDFIGYAHPAKNGKAALGFGAVYLTQGEIEGRSKSGETTGNFTANDLAITITGSRLIKQGVSIGLNLKLIQSKIAGYSSTGFALDAGSLFSLAPYRLPLDIGFAIQNIGSKMKFLEEGYNLPLTMAIGAALPLANYHLPLTFSADLKHQPYDSVTTFSFGAEFNAASILALRAGYLANMARSVSSVAQSRTENISNLGGFGFGLGFKIGSGTLDYSFSPAGDLGNSQRISVAVKF